MECALNERRRDETEGTIETTANVDIRHGYWFLETTLEDDLHEDFLVFAATKVLLVLSCLMDRTVAKSDEHASFEDGSFEVKGNAEREWFCWL